MHFVIKEGRGANLLCPLCSFLLSFLFFFLLLLHVPFAVPPTGIVNVLYRVEKDSVAEKLRHRHCSSARRAGELAVAPGPVSLRCSA